MATVKLSNAAVGLKNGDMLEIGEGQHLALRFPDGRLYQISCTPDDYDIIDGGGRVLITRVRDLETTGGEGWGKMFTKWPTDDRFASENPPDDDDLGELLGDVEEAKLSAGPPTDEVPIGMVDHDDEDRRAYREEIIRDNPFNGDRADGY